MKERASLTKRPYYQPSKKSQPEESKETKVTSQEINL